MIFNVLKFYKIYSSLLSLAEWRLLRRGLTFHYSFTPYLKTRSLGLLVVAFNLKLVFIDITAIDIYTEIIKIVKFIK